MCPAAAGGGGGEQKPRFCQAPRAGPGRMPGSSAILKRLVVRPGAALRGRPIDDLVRVLDVAGLAMHAVGGVYLQAFAARAVVDHLVDVRRAEALARVAELARALLDADARVEHLQVRRLALVVAGGGEENRSEAARRRRGPLPPATVRALVRVQRFEPRVIGFAPGEGPGRASAQHRLEAGVGDAHPEAALEGGLEVAHRAQLLAA